MTVRIVPGRRRRNSRKLAVEYARDVFGVVIEEFIRALRVRAVSSNTDANPSDRGDASRIARDVVAGSVADTRIYEAVDLGERKVGGSKRR